MRGVRRLQLFYRGDRLGRTCLLQALDRSHAAGFKSVPSSKLNHQRIACWSCWLAAKSSGSAVAAPNESDDDDGDVKMGDDLGGDAEVSSPPETLPAGQGARGREQIRLIIDSSDLSHVDIKKLACTIHVRRVGNFYYTHIFAEWMFKHMTLSHALRPTM